MTPLSCPLCTVHRSSPNPKRFCEDCPGVLCGRNLYNALDMSLLVKNLPPWNVNSGLFFEGCTQCIVEVL